MTTIRSQASYHYLGSLRDGEGPPPSRGSQQPRGGVVEADRPAIEAALDAWLAPFLDVMGRVTRRRGAPFSLPGLPGPDGRKSLQPLAARLGLGGHDQLQHFIASPAWDDEPLRRVLAGKADALAGGPEAGLGAGLAGGRGGVLGAAAPPLRRRASARSA